MCPNVDTYQSQVFVPPAGAGWAVPGSARGLHSGAHLPATLAAAGPGALSDTLQNPTLPLVCP